ncbi:glutaminase [Corynebacterium otitidis]|uniref:glutaminase n=1 Tax=Corynebacterium otitidis TaxID=29321 RepID=UPI000627BBFF|nr:glutaminase [Corynebacterium otitidis]KKO83927.1 glutaminase [Corynebacterium otitidis]
MIEDYLHDVLGEVADFDGGSVADYIELLAEADPDPLAAALCTLDGTVYSAGLRPGDDELEFSIQSISKPFVYAQALQELGADEVIKTVGMEPSGEKFNELSLDGDTNRPMNPMINAGAIATTQLINGEDSGVEDRTERIREFLSRLAGRELAIDRRLVESEYQSADRNFALAHMLRNYGVIQAEAQDAVRSYIHQCSIMVTTRDLAAMAATLANGGRQPVTRERILDVDVARQTQAVMSSAGMYNAAGRWMVTVGIPAKSGVAGGVLGTLPGQIGLAAFSPRLDSSGNSFRGVQVFQRLSRDMGLHLMAAEPRGRSAVRFITDKDDTTVVGLQGDIGFSAAERLWRTINRHEGLLERVRLDFTRVEGSNPIGRRMLLEGINRLRDQGHVVEVDDPDDVIPRARRDNARFEAMGDTSAEHQLLNQDPHSYDEDFDMGED